MADHRKIDAELQAALQENQRLREENQRLKELLAEHSRPASTVQLPNAYRQVYLPDPATVAEVAAPADKAAKVALFRALFCGREDVYAVGWRTKDGTWAYRPDARKDWNAVLASRPEDQRGFTARPASSTR